MRSKLLFSVICTGALLCIQPAGVAFAQHGGAGGGMPPSQSPSSPTPNTPGQSPDMNGANGAATNKVDDKKFVKEAAMGGMAEVELGKLATQKGTSESVKQFGQKMIDDHTKANDQLKEVASKDNIQIPAALDKKHQERIDKLSKLDGAAFDKAYAKDQVKDHKNDIKDFQAEAQGGSDPNVKAFATNTLPVLQQHLQLAENLNKSEKSAGASQPSGQ
jgi:putative membrane protein